MHRQWTKLVLKVRDRSLLPGMNTQRWILLICCSVILATSIGSRLYAEFASRTGSRLYFETYDDRDRYVAPFIAPFLVARLVERSVSEFQVVIFWVLLFGIGIVAWKRCAPLLTYSLVVAVAILVLVGELFWIRFQPDDQGRIVPLFESIDMAAIPPFVRAISTSQTMIVFEGLPRNPGSPAAPEQTPTSTFESHRHQFYTSPVPVSGQDASSLSSLVSAPSTFREWRGAKLCFGFHPDWLIRWISADGATHELHLCFGCGEAKIYSPAGRLYCEIGPDARTEFKAILGQYARPRPAGK